ncbi:MAG TPA: ABC transporter ATP-binding protein [Acidimicrobiales bacterium]|nr:ABC transporter ATP-binding protein [Acidimicrobiales bacterium]
MSSRPSASAPAPAPAADRSSADAPLISAEGLTKRFGKYVAVDGVDFTVQRGEVFGFLGPNGAGKTTTMRMIACVSPVTGGELRVLGMNPVHDGPAIRARLGVVPQEDNLDTELTVWDNLLIYGRYFGLPVPVIRERAEELLHFARLDDRRTSRVDPLSGGMKRRLTIARALINRPDLVLLDEPTTGLDPQARHLLWERLYRLKREGVTLVLTTHYMDEAEQLCDRLVIMDEGRIVAEGSPRQLIERHSTREVVELRFAVPEQQDAALPHLDGVGDRVEPVADRVLVYTAHGDDTVARIGEAGVHPDSVLVRRSSLEDVFLRLTGRSLDE